MPASTSPTAKALRIPTEDRLRPNRGVIERLIGFFRRLRSLGNAAGVSDARAAHIFTAALVRLLTYQTVASSCFSAGLAEQIRVCRRRGNRQRNCRCAASRRRALVATKNRPRPRTLFTSGTEVVATYENRHRPSSEESGKVGELRSTIRPLSHGDSHRVPQPTARKLAGSGSAWPHEANAVEMTVLEFRS